jgi:hypothetical protein
VSPAWIDPAGLFYFGFSHKHAAISMKQARKVIIIDTEPAQQIGLTIPPYVSAGAEKVI